MLNETHSLALTSWVESAQTKDCDFPIQNLPFCLFRRKGTSEAFRGGVGIGDQIIDLKQAAALFSGIAGEAARLGGEQTLNALMAAGRGHWSALRLALSRALRIGAAEQGPLRACLVPQSGAEFAVPSQIGDYTDFFTSYHHVVNAGRMMGRSDPMLPNLPWMPLAYHGRASSVEMSGTPFPRPFGQTLPQGAAQPVFGPCQKLDYELELGFYIGPGNARGTRIGIDAAEDHIFGVCILNDWSARDVQTFESTPLGPFLAKNFITSVAPWIVTLEALEPYRTQIEGFPDDRGALPYLCAGGDRRAGMFDITMEAWLATPASTGEAYRLTSTSFRHGWWTLAQMVTHHTENGCNLRPGDLCGTGTQSGPTRQEAGCMLELTWGGTEPVTLPNGEVRAFLHDGDTVILRAHCAAEGKPRIGFGACEGTVLPAVPL